MTEYGQNYLDFCLLQKCIFPVILVIIQCILYLKRGSLKQWMKLNLWNELLFLALWSRAWPVLTTKEDFLRLYIAMAFSVKWHLIGHFLFFSDILKNHGECKRVDPERGMPIPSCIRLHPKRWSLCKVPCRVSRCPTWIFHVTFWQTNGKSAPI